MNGFAVELRRGPGIWAAPLLLVVGASYALGRLEVTSLWSLSSGAVANATLLLGPLTAGIAAWAGARGERRHTGHQARLAAKGSLGAAAAEMLALAVWTLLAYAAVAALILTLTAASATWGSPSWLWLLTAGAGLVAHVPIGWLAGRLLPLLFTPFAVALATFAMAVWADSSAYRYWWSRLFPIRVWVQRPFDEVRALPLLGQLLWYAGLAVAVFAILAVVARERLRLIATLSAVTAVCLVAGASVVGGAGAAFTRPGAYVIWACAGSRPEVCLHPAYIDSMPELRLRAQDVASRLAGTPFAITRVEQRPRGISGGLPGPGAIAFGFDAPTQRHVDRAAFEIATAALRVGPSCLPALDKPEGPGLAAITLVVVWAAGNDRAPVTPPERAAWAWISEQDPATVRTWISAHAGDISTCTLSYTAFQPSAPPA